MRVALAVGLALAWAPSPAWAGVFEVFGAGARSQGMAGTGVSVGRDAGAAWLNPATLTDVDRSVSLGWFSGFDRTSILLMERPEGYAPATYDTRLRPRADTEGGDTASGLIVGLALPVPDWDLALGGVIYAPATGFARLSPHFNDEREQFFSNRLHFELLGDSLRADVFAAGVGWRVAEWMSLGVGVAIMPLNTTDAAVYTPNASDPSTSQIQPNIEQGALKAMTAGVVVRPVKGLRLGASFEDEVFFAVSGVNEVQLRGTERGGAYPVLQHMDVRGSYAPARLSVGASLHGAGLTGAVEGRWRLWRRYRDSFGGDPGFADTVDLSAGLEWITGRGTVVRAGGSWRPSPVPDSSGRSSYVDNERLVLSLGGGRRVELGGQRLDVDLGMQLQGLVPRTVHKELPEGEPPVCAEGVSALCDESPQAPGAQFGGPGFPGWTSGGYLLSASVDVRWLF